MRRNTLLKAPPRHVVRKHMNSFMRECKVVGRVWLKYTKKWSELYEMPGGPYTTYGVLEPNGNCQVNPKSWYLNHKIHPIPEGDEPYNIRVRRTPTPSGIVLVRIMPVGWRPSHDRPMKRIPLKVDTKKKKTNPKARRRRLVRG